MSINLNVTGNTQPLEAAVNAAINRIRKTPIKITVDDKGATQPLGNMKRGADEFSKSMEAANSRIIAFGASMAIINGVADGFKALVRNVVEVEKALADINVVMNLSTANLEKFSNGLFKTAKETGAAFNVAAEAATEYARQGLTMEESLKRTRDALILTRLTGMDSANAVKALTAAMNTYGDQIKDTTELVSKFAAVDVKFAVSAEDFADAISRTGQAAKSAGVDIDELVGLVTAAQQQTARGGKVIGNSFKTIFTRIGRSDTLNQLENLGIAVRDLEGNTLGAKRILTDLANTFDKLTASQQNQIAQTVGGVFQINILKAVLSDAAKQNGILANATQISSGATTEAIDKNDQLRQTMSAMATETGLALKELSAQIGEIMLAPGIEKVLNVFKGLAEGANEMLGGGESTGSDFAQGFLKGLGNIITGPGLVVISAVFIKLFAKALIYANQSLRSLIGVTSEAHKQKAIQTSLVTLFGQNAAISKEMLRTDISRTEKERIILGLLRAQVIEANMLNSVSKSVAGGLYTRGYNASLAPRKVRAGGHIPNFADPERAQAARGGYAAGTIRSMDMPGQGSVIYNSAEKVKNFKGMSQPAIMPPHSSKAGKNYQQAFGDVHGFDPYAAGGYVPNFARQKSTVSKTSELSKTAHINQNSAKYIGLTASNSNDRMGSLYATAGKGRSNVFEANNEPYKKAATKSTGAKIDYEFYSLDDSEKRKYYNSKVEDGLKEDLQRASHGIMNQLLKTLSSKDQNFIAKEADLSKDLPDHKMSVSAGHIFEAAAKTILRSIGAESAIPESDSARIDFKKNQELYELFGVKGDKGSGGAEAKLNDHPRNAKSFARKIYDLEIGSKGATSKPKAPKPKAPNPRPHYQPQNFGNNAEGYIPNFADPLSDAIGRETAAGVPVSQIRVGSHPALMGKSNPIGLGVTNTHDEPNGLRDVIGAANGFVPNYASQDFQEGDLQGQGISKTQRKKLAKNINDQIKAGTLVIKSQQEFAKELKKIDSKLSLHGSGIAKADVEIQKNTATRRTLGSRLKASAKSIGGGIGAGASGAWAGVKKADSWFNGTRPGKMIGSNAGQMGLMMGLPMAAGFAGDAVTSLSGSKAYGQAASGALSGAGSGAAMGMMFGPLGTAIGATVGGLYGLVDGLDQAEKAAIAKAKVERENSVKRGGSLGNQLGGLFKGYTPSAETGLSRKHLSGLRTNEKGFGLIGDRGSSTYQLLKSKLEKEFETELRAFGETQSTGVTANKFDQSFKNTRFRNQGKSVSAIESNERKKPKYDNRRWTGKQGKQVRRDASMDQMIAAEASSLRKQVLVEMLENMASNNPNEKIKTNSLKRFEDSDKTLIKEGEEYSFSAAELLKQVEEVGDISLIKGAYDSAEAKSRELSGLSDEEIAAVIVRLDFQKAQMIAQQAAAVKQLEIKDRYSEISENLKFEVMLMGSLMTDKQKAENKYLQAINKSAEAHEKSAASADAQLRTGLLNQIKGDPGVQGLVKTSLGLEEGSSFQDISEQAGSLSGKDLEEKLREIAGDKGTGPSMRRAILDLLTVEIDKRQNILEIAKKTKKNSKDQATREQKINNILAERKDLIASMSGAIGMSDKQLAHDKKMRGFSSQLDASRRLTAFGPGYKTGKEKEDFQVREKQIALTNSAMSLRSDATSAVNKKTVERTDLELQQQTAQKRVAALEGGAKPTSVNEQKNLNELLIKQQQSLAFIDHEIKNINNSTEAQILNAQELLEEEKKRLELKRKYETGPRAFTNGFKDSAKQMGESVETFNHELGNTVAVNFRDGIAEAMKVGLNGADDLGDALMNIAGNFLSAIQNAFLQNAANAIVSKIPMPSGNYTGGAIRNYSRGGGVPAMVSDGEYVMNSKAVNKYGGSFMHGLNAGGNIPGFSEGGAAPGSALAANFGGGRGVDTGRAHQSKAMSGFFYSQSGNLGLKDDEQALVDVLAEEERKRQEAAAKKAKKRALIKQIIGTAASFAVSYGLSGGFSGGGAKQGMGRETLLRKPASSFENLDSFSSDFTSPSRGALNEGIKNGNASSLFDYYNGGPIRKYASGGHIAGKSGIDQIPAMLSEGEYVIRSSSARQIGKPTLDRINAGKFNDGGSVSPINSSSESAASGGSTNNINISINMENGKAKNGSSSSSSSGGNSSEASDGQEDMVKLGEKVKQQVLTVIVEEKRPGGLLHEQS